MAVLVTGGAGFVGSHLVDRLADDGERVVVVDSLVTGRLANLARALSGGRVTFVFYDLAGDLAELPAQLRAAGVATFERIYHLASPASPDAYGRMPWETLRVNSAGTMALIDLALEHGARFVLASTSEAYGDPLVHPQPESYFGNVNPVGPRACYDEGKRFAEAAVSVATRARGLDARIVRIFNCYGPRMSLLDGRLIPAFVEALRRGAPFPIQGDGTQTRSLTYVDDLIDGILTVAAAAVDGLQPVNLGNDDERTVLEIARTFAGVAGAAFAVEHLAARDEDPQRRCPDTSFSRALGWQATTALADGLAEVHHWSTREALQYA